MIAAVFLAFPFVAAGTPDGHRSAADWRALAGTDLDEIHRLIGTAHPGAIDDQNPEFRRWMEKGYRQARALLPRVRSYTTGLAVVLFYTAGFDDAHLLVSDQMRPRDESIVFAGWVVHLVNNRYVVTADAPHWPGALPPVGSTLWSCDGRTVDAILDEDVAPISLGRLLARSDLVPFIGTSGEPVARPLGACTFLLPNGTRRAFVNRYRPVAFDEWLQFFHAGERISRAAPRENSMDVVDGVLWVRAQRFDLDAEGSNALHAMLERAPPPSTLRAIVFDVRNNRGGDSTVGQTIFEALTGGLAFDEAQLADRPATFALWRVSPLSIAKLVDMQARLAADSHRDSHEAAVVDDLLKNARRASAAHEDWVRQDDGDRRITREDITAADGHLRKFTGAVAVLTDNGCVSACLDFVDTVRQVPGSLHLGATTGADTNYIDVARVQLPSGNALVMPVKVWRNRLRASNEALVPMRTFDGELSDDASVRAWVLRQLETNPR